jgi:hypothetical protein
MQDKKEKTSLERFQYKVEVIGIWKRRRNKKENQKRNKINWSKFWEDVI